MDKEYYQLGYEWFDEHEVKIFYGDKVEWNELCHELLQEAQKKALEYAIKYNDYLGYRDIFRELVESLITRGYVLVTLDTFSMGGDDIIDEHDWEDNYNQRFLGKEFLSEAVKHNEIKHDNHVKKWKENDE